jgi:predicted esterase YcpF (UPF0227 family)
MKIIYLHGLGTGGPGQKATLFQHEFGERFVTAPMLPLDPNDAEHTVSEIILENYNKQLLFVGISLGGFWANYFAQKCHAPCLLINPMLKPSMIMHTPIAKRFGRLMNRFIPTELVSAIDGYLTDFGEREKYVEQHMNGKYVHLFLSADDKIVSYKNALEYVQNPASCTIKTTGGHSFDEHFSEVLDKASEILL